MTGVGVPVGVRVGVEVAAAAGVFVRWATSGTSHACPLLGQKSATRSTDPMPQRANSQKGETAVNCVTALDAIRCLGGTNPTKAGHPPQRACPSVHPTDASGNKLISSPFDARHKTA